MKYCALIPAAGKGIRALSLTGFGVSPKPFIALGESTVFTQIIDEILKAGIETLYLIVSGEEDERLFRRFFDPFGFDPALEKLVRAKLPQLLPQIEKINSLNVHYIYQREPLGFGHAVGLSWPEIKGENYDGILVCLGDDLIWNAPPAAAQLIEAHQKLESGMVFMTEEVSRESAKKFGVVQISDKLSYSGLGKALFAVSKVVEKPQNPEPNIIDGEEKYFAVVGRYLLEPEDIEFLYSQNPTPGRELDFTPLFARNAQLKRLYTLVPTGRFATVGNVVDYQKSAVRYALLSYKKGERELAAAALEAMVELGILKPTADRTLTPAEDLRDLIEYLWKE